MLATRRRHYSAFRTSGLLHCWPSHIRSKAPWFYDEYVTIEFVQYALGRVADEESGQSRSRHHPHDHEVGAHTTALCAHLSRHVSHLNMTSSARNPRTLGQLVDGTRDLLAVQLLYL